MDITDLPREAAPWKILGTGDGAKISVAPPTSIRIEACGLVAVVPLPLVLALQTPDAINFVKDPAVAPFMYAANDRDSRIRAARLVANRKLASQRRDFVASLKAQFAVSDAEAWNLARLKYPFVE